MRKLSNIGYSLRDVAIVQETISYIKSRKDVNPFVKTCRRDTLPIFVAPMDAVTDENNYEKWIDNKLVPVIPRTVGTRLSINERLRLAKRTFVSFSLSEINDLFVTWDVNDALMHISEEYPIYICIDIAHGTMEHLLHICTAIKETYGQRVIIMTGNIANPDAYKLYCKARIDYVRCGIGGGSRCTTSANVGVHYPMATLLDEICHYKRCMLAENEYNKFPETDPRYNFVTKVIADGGISWFDDINKAFAIGADYVMCGKMFAECEEASGEIVWTLPDNNLDVVATQELIPDSQYQIIKNDNPVYLCMSPYRIYKGMSTREAQKEMGGEGNKTSEGIIKPVEVKYPVAKLVNNIESYLRSAMSYTNSKNIREFNDSQIIILGGNSYNSFAK